MLHIFIADGFEEIEALTTIDILRRCGIEVVTVSVTGTRLIKGSHGIPVMVDTVFRKGEISQSQGLILPGGMPGAQNLYLHEGLRKSLIAHNMRETLICCHLRGSDSARTTATCSTDDVPPCIPVSR